MSILDFIFVVIADIDEHFTRKHDEKLKRELKDISGSAPKELSQIVGGIGTTTSALKPTGMVEIEGQSFNAKSSGEFIAPGTPVRVIAMVGGDALVQNNN
jgi:membrane-bound serine protease (ClpP class)